MVHPRFSDDEIVRRGSELYQRSIRAVVEAGNHGKFVVIDVETGEYEVDSDNVAAYDRAAAKRPSPALYFGRIGHPTTVRIGGFLGVVLG